MYVGHFYFILSQMCHCVLNVRLFSPAMWCMIMGMMTQYTENRECSVDDKLCKGVCFVQVIVCWKNYMYEWMYQGQKD